jgi:hypothetical protein
MNKIASRFHATTVMRIVAFPLLAAAFIVDASGQIQSVPLLGSHVPEQVIRARAGDQQCLVDLDRHDPCASVKIKGILFTIAWDAETRAISYLFTDDHHFVTDSELGIGGSCNVAPKTGEPVALFPYLDGLVAPKWSDAKRDMSGNAVWYAVLHRDTLFPRRATITGFVQSRFLEIASQEQR